MRTWICAILVMMSMSLGIKAHAFDQVLIKPFKEPDYSNVLYPLIVMPDRFFMKTTPAKKNPLLGACGLNPDSADDQEIEDAWSYDQADRLEKWVNENRPLLLGILVDKDKRNSLVKYLNSDADTSEVMRIFNNLYYRSLYQCTAGLPQLDFLGTHVKDFPLAIEEWEKSNGYPPFQSYEAIEKHHKMTIKEEHRIDVLSSMAIFVVLGIALAIWRKKA